MLMDNFFLHSKQDTDLQNVVYNKYDMSDTRVAVGTTGAVYLCTDKASRGKHHMSGVPADRASRADHLL